MKTKIKHLSKCALSAVLAVAMLMSTTLVGSVSAVGTAETTETQTEAVQNDTAQPAAEQTAEETEQKNDAEEAVAAAVPEKKALQASGSTGENWYLGGRITDPVANKTWTNAGDQSFKFTESDTAGLYYYNTNHSQSWWNNNNNYDSYRNFVLYKDSTQYGGYNTTQYSSYKSSGSRFKAATYLASNESLPLTSSNSISLVIDTTSSNTNNLIFWIDSTGSSPTFYYTYEGSDTKTYYYYNYDNNLALSTVYTGTSSSSLTALDSSKIEQSTTDTKLYTITVPSDHAYIKFSNGTTETAAVELSGNEGKYFVPGTDTDNGARVGTWQMEIPTNTKWFVEGRLLKTSWATSATDQPFTFDANTGRYYFSTNQTITYIKSNSGSDGNYFFLGHSTNGTSITQTYKTAANGAAQNNNYNCFFSGADYETPVEMTTSATKNLSFAQATYNLSNKPTLWIEYTDTNPTFFYTLDISQEVSTHPVYFYNILGWTNLQGNYTTGGTTSTLTATAATDIGANWYKVEVPDTATSSDTLYFSGVRSEGVSGMTIRTEAYTCPTTSSNDKYFVPMYYTYYTSKTANGPQKVGCYVQSTTSDEITLESGKSYIYLRKNSYISGWTNIFAHLYKANDSTVKGTTWHGYRFRKVSGYTDLYAIEAFADTTNATFNFANCNRIAVSDGKDDAHAYEDSTHQVTHRFLTYELNINNVFTPLSTNSKTDTLDGSTTIYRREAEWQDFDRNLDTVASGKVRIYAKTGTIRTDATDTYDKYSRLADVQVAFKSGGTSYTANGANNTQDRETWGVYYKRTPYLDLSSNKHYRKVIADADANQEVTITVTLRDVNNVRDRYYVKAFIINGETYQVNTHNANGVYTMSFTPNDTYGSYIEVTPVYYYNESSTYNGTGNSYITLQVDDYETVEDIWGCTVAAYAWYVDAEDSTTVTTAQTGTATNALSNYPGQPMIKIGLSYYMQIPKNIYGTTKAVKGVTMNNYMWDDVHSEITEFLINNGISGATDFTGGHALDGTSLRTKNERNCQTYDFDDFVALAARNANKIRFTFKYRTWHSSRGADGGNFHVGDSVQTFTSTATTEANNLEQFVTTPGGNGWEALMDDYEIPVDLFANRLTWSQAYQNIDNTVNSSANTIFSNDTYINQKFVESCKDNITDAVYVVSDGYENYYEYDGSTRVNDYIGEYATMWYVYKRNTDGTFRFIGALPPSAFLSDCINADGSVTQSNYLNYSDTAQIYRTAGRSYTNSGKALYTTYKAIYDECANCPVVIAYESAIYSEGRTGSTGTGQLATLNRGYRCDGRWTYSKASQTVSADIEIQIVTLNSETGKVATRTLDGFAAGTGATGYTGSTTNADAYFTNSDFARTVSSPDVVENADKNFTFTASSFKKGTDNKYYVFNGWQVVNGSITDDNRSLLSIFFLALIIWTIQLLRLQLTQNLRILQTDWEQRLLMLFLQTIARAALKIRRIHLILMESQHE